ncbi:MAG: hypothetical protein C4532_16620 [Candidatus Abyssobacteria bacterium SURF_17]|uniref:Uncharacterized protein n=1 Tax=Candidatus Abyssobacteria bacterium SURF_17 TaxID=2093361 RepID=A0A419ERK4_9BACT|nr:MAG: hypothetical protein C4532_16620 [Candidatus Abyssubacteria bacterium SURF_17]
MEGKRDRVVVKQGIRLAIMKAILGAAAAIVAMMLMRLFGWSEITVAVCIGLVPGISEKSLRKALAGAVLGFVGYSVGARVGATLARSFSGVPLGHWAVVGAFIGLTAGMVRQPGQWFSFRFIVWWLGCVWGIVLGLVFGIMGDIGGFFTIPAYELPLFYYMREVSLICAGVFINLGVAVASVLASVIDNALSRVARSVERAEA